MRNNVLKSYESFYFIGVGGVSMSALCKIIHSLKKQVSGCDLVASEYTQELIKLGIDIQTGDVQTSIKNYDVIVYTDAIKRGNKQLEEAIGLNKIILSRGQLLALVCKYFKRTIGVSGCHGKTTCTSMLAHILLAEKTAFCCHIGGNDCKLGNYYNCGRDYFVTEACEYKKNFLYLSPDVGIILNSRPDHLECYGGENNLKAAYKKFAKQSKKVVTIYGEEIAANAITFGLDERANYCAKNIKSVNGKYAFNAYENGKLFGKIQLNVYGKHNILNALAAIAASRILEISFENINKGLKNFVGVERRFDFIGKINGAVCIADYAHHPDEIKTTILTARKIKKGNLFVIFQPHTYSRTKNFFAQFVHTLCHIKHLLIYKTFAAREYYDEDGSALTLSKAIKCSKYGDSEEDIKSFLKDVKPDDLVLFLGAGDIYYIAKKLIKNGAIT